MRIFGRDIMMSMCVCLLFIYHQVRLNVKHGDHGHRHGHPSCYGRGKQLLHKIFKKETVSKSCENLYVL